MTARLFMVVERFRPGMTAEIYRRFRERGRMMPPDVRYVASWVDVPGERCFQVMEAQDVAALKRWTANWEDLADFEFIPVVTSHEASAASPSSPAVPAP